MPKLTKHQIEFQQLSYEECAAWREKALAKYDNAIFCPVCRGLLTGLHERSTHFIQYIDKQAAKMWKESKNT